MGQNLVNTESNIRIAMCGKGAQTFTSLLENSRIEYKSRSFPPGTIVAAGESIEIAVAFVSALGIVIAAWITSRNSRSASITHVNNSITQINISMSPEEIAKALETARTVMIVDTKPRDE